MDSVTPLRFIVAGRIHRDFLLLNSGQAWLDVPGGNLLYAASGLAIWEKGIGLLGRVSRDFPTDWLELMAAKGFDRRGIRVLPELMEMRRFTAYTDGAVAHADNPVSHFARLGLPFPKNLLDYRESTPQLDSRTRLAQSSVRLSDIPADFMDAAAAHICPLDYLAHSLLPSTLRQGHITTLTLDPSPGYMNPAFWDYIPPILTGLSAFLTNEEKIRSLFQGRTSDLWEMAEALSGYGCELVVIKRGERGQYLYDAPARARYTIPAYPARIVDPTGAGDAFCGGFLAGYRSTYEPLQGVLYGNISASFTVEGSGAFYAMEAFPRLAEARRLALQDMVRKV